MPRRTFDPDSSETEDHDPAAFDRFLDAADRSRSGMADAWVEVADTAEGAKKWFSSQKQDYTAADIIALTQLVITQHGTIADRHRHETATENDDSLIAPILEELRTLSNRIADLSKEIQLLRK